MNQLFEQKQARAIAVKQRRAETTGLGLKLQGSQLFTQNEEQIQGNFSVSLRLSILIEDYCFDMQLLD
ncbi:hypothetical protein ACO0K7_07260 [Undibacterium sp. Ji67W]|uniref:hypothetical protein n=1 Tax=Undibacterium sp. Ji67W TaxID=3413042 RepID=UPI003BF243EF